MARLRSNRVCFTLNNYSEEEFDGLTKYFHDNPEKIIYGVIGMEIGENGTPHLQGFLNLREEPKKCGLKWWKAELPGGSRMHFEGARGTDAQSKEYCTKEGPFMETGEPQEKQASVWQRIIEASHISKEAALAVDCEITVKHFGNIMQLVHLNCAVVFEAEVELRPWQIIVLEKLENQDDRRILFVVDEKGAAGKSMLAKHILTTKKNSWGCQGKQDAALYETKLYYIPRFARDQVSSRSHSALRSLGSTDYSITNNAILLFQVERSVT